MIVSSAIGLPSSAFFFIADYAYSNLFAMIVVD
jgi:hypothetical protein